MAYLMAALILGVLLGLWLLPDQTEEREVIRSGCSCSVNEPTKLCAYCTQHGTELYRNGHN